MKESAGITNGIFNELPPNFIISKDKSHIILTKEIEKSQNDDRSYRIIRLPNELEVLIIHDAKSDKAAASLDINVGSFSDPVSKVTIFVSFCKLALEV